MSPECPSADTLRAYLDGRLDGPESARLESHVGRCPACLGAARSVPAGAWLARTARSNGDWIPAEERPVLDDLLRRAGSVYATEVASPAPPDVLGELRRLLGGRGGEFGRIGSYRLFDLLGMGGMGVVLRAEDERLRRPVALKLLRPDLACRSDSRSRFLREARALAAVAHDHVVPVYEVGEVAGLPYLVMPLLPGQPLSAWIAAHAPAPVSLAVRWARQAAQGLAAVHAAGLVHRDIKPSNLWLEGEPGGVSPGSSRVKLLDFGLARGEQEGSTPTLPGVLLGTPEYFAPEQARGEPVDGRADLFALGCVLHELLTGVSPFRRRTLLATLSALSGEEPTDIRRHNPAVPPALAELVRGLLAKSPENRPPSAEEVARDLAAIEAGTHRRPSGRARRIGLLALVSAVLILAVGSRFLSRSGDTVEPELPAPAPAPVKRPSIVPAVTQPRVTPGRLLGHTAAVTFVLFLPGGDEVVSGSADRTVRRWSLVRWKESAPAVTLPERCVGLALSPDGSALAVASTGGVQVRGTSSRKLLADLPEPSPVQAVAFGGDTDTLFLGTDKGVTRWSLRARQRKEGVAWGLSSIRWLGVAPKGEWLAGGTSRADVLFRSLSRPQAFQFVWAHKAPLMAGAFSPDGTKLATVAGPPDGLVRIWNIADRRPVEADPPGQPFHNGGAVAVAWSVSDRIASAGVDGVVRLWEPDTGKVRGALQAHRPGRGPGADVPAVTFLAFSPDGRRLAAGGADGSVGIFEVSEIENPPRR